MAPGVVGNDRAVTFETFQQPADVTRLDERKVDAKDYDDILGNEIKPCGYRRHRSPAGWVLDRPFDLTLGLVSRTDRDRRASRRDCGHGPIE